MSQITCTKVSKSYEGDGVTTYAIQNASLVLRKGEFVSLVGASGSGKSTLLSLIGSLDTPTKGTVVYGEDRQISNMSRKALADFRFEQIGFIFQQFHLLPALTAFENVLTPLFARKVHYDKKKRAKEALKEVGLANKMDSLPSQLSGGEQQRVAIARATIHEPAWLLADEPTGNLDTETGERIFQLLVSLNKEKGCGVLFATHAREMAERAARFLEMKDGKIILDTDLRSAGYTEGERS